LEADFGTAFYKNEACGAEINHWKQYGTGNASFTPQKQQRHHNVGEWKGQRKTMNTEATVSRGPVEGRFKIEDTSWLHCLGAAGARNATTALFIGMSGELNYEHLLELCSYIRRYWKPAKEHLVLDFTNLISAEADGLLFMMSHLYKAASESVGDIYLVRAPFEASTFLKRMWGSPKIHFADSVEQVIGLLR
jgi:hypothetical protein